MTVSKVENCSNFNELIDSIEIEFICPTCKAKKYLEFPKSVINKANNLTTISIPKGIICEHHFQAFIDKNFKVRGYQKVHFEFGRKIESKVVKRSQKNSEVKDDKELFQNLLKEGNYLEYIPDNFKEKLNTLNPSKSSSSNRNKPNILAESNTLSYSKKNSPKPSLKEIYEKLWRIIDDKNPAFEEFINNDERRNNPDNLICIAMD